MPAPNVTAELRHEGEVGGSTDADTGVFTPAPPPAAYATVKGFYLDEGTAVQYDRTGQVPVIQADGQLFLPRGSVAKHGIREKDLVSLTYSNGDVESGRVLKAVRATSIIYLESV